MKFQKLAILLLLLISLPLSAQTLSPLADKVDDQKIKGMTAPAEKMKRADFINKLFKHYTTKPNIYQSVKPSDVTYIKKTYPDDVKEIIKVADEVCNKYFLFRYEWDMEKTSIPYQFKGDIDWKVIPFKDPEWCYMLNRHRYWMDLGKAYFLTGNEKYARVWVDQVSDWIRKNPVEDKTLHGLTWRRIEAGIRCENWIKSWELMKYSPAVTPEFLEMFLNSLYQHAEFINSAYSDFSKTSNWGILEYHGLFNTALFLSEFKNSDTWKNDALRKLEMCADIQMLPDGVQWEQSPMYHNEVLHCLMNVVLLGDLNHIEIPELIRKKVHRMAWVNVEWQKPNYNQPLIGDSDDSDLRGLLTLATWIYKDGGLKSRAHEKLDFLNYFVLGAKGNSDYMAVTPKNPDFLSVYQPFSGDVFMRNSWGEDASYLQFHVQRIGDGHAHDDLLHISLFANGRDYLVDGGRYTYTETKERKLLKSSESHNGVGVDGEPNSIYSNTWGNSFNARSKYVYTHFSKSFDYAESTNEGYQRLADPVSVTRRVLYLKPGMWLILDHFVARGTHRYSQFFSFTDKNVIVNDSQVSTTSGKDDLVVKMVKPASINLTDAVWSPEYNTMVENKRAEVFVEKEGSHSMVAALYFPDRANVSIQPVQVTDRGNRILKASEAEAFEINYDGKQFVLMVVNNIQSPANPFYKVNGEIVSGDVVLLEKVDDHYLKHVIR